MSLCLFNEMSKWNIVDWFSIIGALFGLISIILTIGIYKIQADTKEKKLKEIKDNTYKSIYQSAQMMLINPIREIYSKKNKIDVIKLKQVISVLSLLIKNDKKFASMFLNFNEMRDKIETVSKDVFDDDDREYIFSNLQNWENCLMTPYDQIFDKEEKEIRNDK